MPAWQLGGRYVVVIPAENLFFLNNAIHILINSYDSCQSNCLELVAIYLKYLPLVATGLTKEITR